MNKKKTRTSGGTGIAARDRQGSSGGSLTRGGNGPKDQRSVSSPGLDEEGAYSNQRVTYICSSLIGNIVKVETDDGIVFEGVFRTFSPDLDITLEQVHQVDPEDPHRIDPATVNSTGVFNMKRIIRCVAQEVDLNAARMDQGGFMTDTQISGGAKVNGERTLEKWVPDGEDDHGCSLELDEREAANGWRAEDMFKANEDTYGVTSSYKSNLEGYTVQLNADKDSEKYRELEAKAEALAREIEGSGTNKLAIELENGDEEEAFSAVVRSNNRGDSGEGGKYVTPARRPPQAGGGNNSNRNTPQQQQQLQRQQQSSPASMSRSGVDDRHRGQRRDFQSGTSPSTGYHDDYPRGGAGRGRGAPPGGSSSVRGGPGGGRGEKSRNEQTSEFKNFRENFHLQTSDQQRYFEKQPSPKLSSPPSTSAHSRGSPHDRKGTSPPTTTTTSDHRRTSPPTASIIARQDSVEQRTPTPAKTPPTVVAASAPPIATAPAVTTASTAASTATTTTAAASGSNINVSKSKLNPNAKEFVLNPKAKEFIPPSARPPVGQTPPPRPITPATPTGGNIPMGYYPTIQPGGFNPYMVTMPNVSVASSYISYAPTSQPPPPQYTQQTRFRSGAPPSVSSAAGGPRDGNNQVLAGQPLLSPQNNFTLIPPMPHMPPQVQQAAAAHQHQQIAMTNNMVPVSGGPPFMVRPMEGAWSIQPNQPPPQMGGPPPPAGTPTNANQPPMSTTPPTSGVVQPPAANHQGGPPPINGNAPSPAGMYNFIQGSMQHQSLPPQFTYPQLLLQHGQTPLLQQPIMTQGQPVTSIASGIQQFPYGVPHSHHGVVPGQQNSPGFILAPHMMPVVSTGNPVAAAGGQGAPVAAAGGTPNQMQPPPQ